jgi:hypothetical protein
MPTRDDKALREMLSAGLTDYLPQAFVAEHPGRQPPIWRRLCGPRDEAVFRSATSVQSDSNCVIMMKPWIFKPSIHAIRTGSGNKV